MKKLTIAFMLLVLSSLANLYADDNFRCLPGAYTENYQAPFCHLVSDNRDHCHTIGCDWVQRREERNDYGRGNFGRGGFEGGRSEREASFRCLPGRYTESYQAPFCHIVTDNQQHCEVIGCEWVRSRN